MSPEAFEALKVIIHEAMLEYPHAEPNPETVEAIAQGLVAVIAVSNARPERYAGEPWLNRSAAYHADHAAQHAINAELSMRPDSEGEFPWLTDLGQPEIAHACMRSMLCMYQHRRGRVV